jgi:hypothetical protein
LTLFDGDQEMKGSYNFSEKLHEWGFLPLKTALFEIDFERNSNEFFTKNKY